MSDWLKFSVFVVEREECDEREDPCRSSLEFLGNRCGRADYWNMVTERSMRKIVVYLLLLLACRLANAAVSTEFLQGLGELVITKWHQTASDVVTTST